METQTQFKAVEQMDKFCSYCEVLKPISQFRRSRSKPGGYQQWCKACEIERKDAIAGTVKVSEKRCTVCKEVKPAAEFGKSKNTRDSLAVWCIECARWKNLEREYGVTRQGFQAMFLAQRGCCKICGEPSTATLHVDHDHKTKKVRALLCGNCNRAIGLLNDSADKAYAAARYLEEYQ